MRALEPRFWIVTGDLILDNQLFDRLARRLAAALSRRQAAALLLSAAVPPPLWLASRTTAKNKKRNKPKKNEFGCLDVGKKCNGKNSKCCSGICKGKRPRKGKKDKSKCVAHNVLECQLGEDTCLLDSIRCGTDTSSHCFRTTGKAGFCGAIDTGVCIQCARDTDCEPTFGPGAACVACPDCGLAVTTACFAPGA
jgi:hypothetical protein